MDEGLFLHFGDGFVDGIEDAIGQFQHIDAVVDGDGGRVVVDDGVVETFQFRLYGVNRVDFRHFECDLLFAAIGEGDGGRKRVGFVHFVMDAENFSLLIESTVM